MTSWAGRKLSYRATAAGWQARSCSCSFGVRTSPTRRAWMPGWRLLGHRAADGQRGAFSRCGIGEENPPAWIRRFGASVWKGVLEDGLGVVGQGGFCLC